MTFMEYLKQEKGVEYDSADLTELMDKYYEEYREFLLENADGCGTE